MPFDDRRPAPDTLSRCRLCPAASRCLATAVAPCDRAAWDQAERRLLALPRAGLPLFRAGDRFDAVYIVRAGCVKTYTVDADGTERVRGFFLPGDAVGLDALGADAYPAHAQAVSPSQVCRLDRATVDALLARSPSFAQSVLQRMGTDLRASLALGGDYTADQRLAAFLTQMRQRGDDTVVHLPMTRRDIGNHLRLATETVCRVLARFEDSGLVSAHDRTVTLRDPAALAAIAQRVGLAPALS